MNDIWIVSTDGSAPARKLTAGKAGESGYTWSPDGKFLAFVAKRDGDEMAQIYTINIKEGGEAQRLTNLSTGASAPKWSPDGKMILFNSSVFPTCFSDWCNKRMTEEKKKSNTKQGCTLPSPYATLINGSMKCRIMPLCSLLNPAVSPKIFLLMWPSANLPDSAIKMQHGALIVVK